MTEEEKKAIERLEEIADTYDDLKSDYEYGHLSSFELDLDNVLDIRIVLNLIQKQQAEIEKLKQIKVEPMIDALGKRYKVYRNN